MLTRTREGLVSYGSMFIAAVWFTAAASRRFLSWKASFRSRLDLPLAGVFLRRPLFRWRRFPRCFAGDASPACDFAGGGCSTLRLASCFRTNRTTPPGRTSTAYTSLSFEPSLTARRTSRHAGSRGRLASSRAAARASSLRAVALDIATDIDTGTLSYLILSQFSRSHRLPPPSYYEWYSSHLTGSGLQITLQEASGELGTSPTPRI